MNGSSVDPTNLIFIELSKLVLQFVGALLIARIAVRWALNRYKSEKLWERRLAVFSDVVSALRDLRSVYGDYEEEALMGHNYSSDHHLVLNERLKRAHNVLREASSHARLLLPPYTSKIIDELEIELAKIFEAETTRLEAAQAGWELVVKAMDRVLVEGKQVLGASTIDRH